jgi:hypothetical protein
MQYYPSACSICQGEEARRRYQEAHEQDILQDVADAENAPTMMNHAKALTHGRAVEGGNAEKDYGYKGQLTCMHGGHARLILV